jgi:hypothetical protein
MVINHCYNYNGEIHWFNRKPNPLTPRDKTSFQYGAIRAILFNSSCITFGGSNVFMPNCSNS